MSIAEDAIARSISERETITIPFRRDTFDAHLLDLLDVSEDSEDVGEAVIFWGCRGVDNWRVRLLTGVTP